MLCFNVTGDLVQNSMQYLLQCISVAVQRGYAAAILGSLVPSEQQFIAVYLLIFSCPVDYYYLFVLISSYHIAIYVTCIYLDMHTFPLPTLF